MKRQLKLLYYLARFFQNLDQVTCFWSVLNGEERDGRSLIGDCLRFLKIFTMRSRRPRKEQWLKTSFVINVYLYDRCDARNPPSCWGSQSWRQIWCHPRRAHALPHRLQSELACETPWTLKIDLFCSSIHYDYKPFRTHSRSRCSLSPWMQSAGQPSRRIPRVSSSAVRFVPTKMRILVFG